MIVVTAMPVVNAKARTITTKMTPDLANRQGEHGRNGLAFCDRNHATPFFSWKLAPPSRPFPLLSAFVGVPALFQGAGRARSLPKFCCRQPPEPLHLNASFR